MTEKAISFKGWIDAHRDLLKPPVGNKVVWPDREFIVMVVGGPNARDDYHINEGEEFFYQLEGDMVLRILRDGKPEDVTIREGEIYLLPAGLPHSPQREANTVGLVVERRRLPHEQDGLMWICPECHGELYSERFHLTNIETQFAAVFDRFFNSPENSTCKRCNIRLTR